jgi:hypothetical protein
VNVRQNPLNYPVIEFSPPPFQAHEQSFIRNATTNEGEPKAATQFHELSMTAAKLIRILPTKMVAIEIATRKPIRWQKQT